MEKVYSHWLIKTNLEILHKNEFCKGKLTRVATKNKNERSIIDYGTQKAGFPKRSVPSTRGE